MRDNIGDDENLKEQCLQCLGKKQSWLFSSSQPCSQCIAGMSECLQMPPSCGLRELQSRVVQWVGRHYVRVWPHRAFASVPEPQQQLCYTATLQALVRYFLGLLACLLWAMDQYVPASSRRVNTTTLAVFTKIYIDRFFQHRYC